jgi:formate dehydrogenase subunit gamma
MSSHNESVRVLKHPLVSRMFHWGLILGFLPAAVTGFILWLKPGNEDFVNLAMHVHIVGAAILTVSAILYSIFCLDRIVAFVRRIFTWNGKDIAWMLVGGGYPQKMLLGRKIAVPPMGKINTGQKIFSICILLGGITLIFSGWILYAFIPLTPKVFVYYADKVHFLLGAFLGLFLLVHIFLGVYNWGEFKAMFGDGTQPLQEAEENNPLWVQDEIEAVGSPAARGQVSAQ